ncbi:hypothetical conserved protein [Oceanobacillus iheyensis HTE831]|uniref:Hypothetical conserved protein n=1 Tax=Oceanobacillus iheyensis (strain DSM 14371 / CIP 107618 / JCM 11309 / KCTC 3954 / HTE831) TaxID=221109 RepID=Q8CUU3_OCEIH|nr:hypothetical conserved protein [Oceanobacillus iheyensis HTE831]
MKGSHIVFIIIVVILLTGFLTWLWLQNFTQNEESISSIFSIVNNINK